jgi:GNAT superfamily N-acetyltransferase
MSKENTYFDYLREREGVEVLKTEHAFALYKVVPEHKTVYLQDVFVEPDFRKLGIGRSIVGQMESLCKELGFLAVITSVDCNANGCTDSLKAILKTGFELSHCDGSTIFLIKKV